MLLEDQRLVYACRKSFLISMGLFIILILLVLLAPIMLNWKFKYLNFILNDSLPIYITTLGTFAFLSGIFFIIFACIVVKRVAKIIGEKKIFQILEEKHGKGYILKRFVFLIIIVFLFLICDIASKIELLGKEFAVIAGILLLFCFFFNLYKLFNLLLNDFQLMLQTKKSSSQL